MDVGSGRVLLLDLDGVVVLESGPPLCESLRILILHEQLDAHLARLEMPVFVLTHRSRAEALQILGAAGVPMSRLAGVFAAEDIFLSAIRHGSALKLMRHGLRKSLILPELQRRTGIKRARTIFIDDRMDNVDDMHAAGVGLVLHAPSEIASDGLSFVTFDFADAIQEITDWSEQLSRVTKLRDRRLAREQAHNSGMNTTRHSRHLFNIIRPMRRRVASFIGGFRKRARGRPTL